jgi:hypothetical protein
VCNGQVVTVTFVETANESTFVTVRVGSTVFVVQQGVEFGGGFRVESIEGSCARLSYRGQTLPLLCTDGTVLK